MKSSYRWYVAFVFFLFLLLHQADKLLIGPLTSAIMADFQINEAQMGAVSSLAIIVASLLYLELGWGERKVRVNWEIQFGISDGRILAVEPRFRGPEVVAPTEVDDQNSSQAPAGGPTSHWEPDGPLGVWFRTRTSGNPNTSTPATQGVCLEVEIPAGAEVRATINGRRMNVPLARLLEGARAGRLGKIASPAYRFHRAPRRWEFDWHGEWEDRAPDPERADAYTLRVRQMNDQWAWSSPIRVGGPEAQDEPALR